MLKCMICGKQYKHITPTHTMRKHGITVAQYREQFPDAPIVCDEVREQMCKLRKEEWKDEDYRAEMCIKHKEKWKNEEYATKQRAKLGSEETRARMSASQYAKAPHSEETKAKRRQSNIAAYERDPTIRQRITKSLLKWYSVPENKDWWYERSKDNLQKANARPNISESAIDVILLPLGFNYTGGGIRPVKDGKRFMYPDFVHEELRIVVELNGERFHTKEGVKAKTARYRKLGWLVVNIWSKEFWGWKGKELLLDRVNRKMEWRKFQLETQQA